MGEFMPGHLAAPAGAAAGVALVQLALATPVVLWGGWPFFVRGWQSLVNRSLNMFTLIALGVGVAYALQRGRDAGSRASFPPSFRDHERPGRPSTSRRRP